jgi:hypothetical protein
VKLVGITDDPDIEDLFLNLLMEPRYRAYGGGTYLADDPHKLFNVDGGSADNILVTDEVMEPCFDLR